MVSHSLSLNVTWSSSRIPVGWAAANKRKVRFCFFKNEQGATTTKNAIHAAMKKKQTWRIEKSPTTESLRLQLETNLHKCKWVRNPCRRCRETRVWVYVRVRVLFPCMWTLRRREGFSHGRWCSRPEEDLFFVLFFKTQQQRQTYMKSWGLDQAVRFTPHRLCVFINPHWFCSWGTLI